MEKMLDTNKQEAWLQLPEKFEAKFKGKENLANRKILMESVKNKFNGMNQDTKDQIKVSCQREIESWSKDKTPEQLAQLKNELNPDPNNASRNWWKIAVLYLFDALNNIGKKWTDGKEVAYTQLERDNDGITKGFDKANEEIKIANPSKLEAWTKGTTVVHETLTTPIVPEKKVADVLNTKPQPIPMENIQAGLWTFPELKSNSKINSLTKEIGRGEKELKLLEQKRANSNRDFPTEQARLNDNKKVIDENLAKWWDNMTKRDNAKQMNDQQQDSLQSDIKKVADLDKKIGEKKTDLKNTSWELITLIKETIKSENIAAVDGIIWKEWIGRFGGEAKTNVASNKAEKENPALDKVKDVKWAKVGDLQPVLDAKSVKADASGNITLDIQLGDKKISGIKFDANGECASAPIKQNGKEYWFAWLKAENKVSILENPISST